MKRFPLALLLVCGLGFGCSHATPPPTSPPPSPQTATSCTPATGPPSDESRNKSAQLADEILDKTFATLGNEFPDRKKQYIPRETVAIQRYPRITFPVLVDPEPASKDGTRQSDGWFVPAVIDWGRIGKLEPKQVTSALRFWLVPHAQSSATDSWKDVTECLVLDSAGSAPMLTVPPNPGKGLLARGEELRGLAFEIPTRMLDSSKDIAAKFYDLKILPKLYSLDDIELGTPGLSAIASALAEGDWASALTLTSGLSASDLSGATAASDLEELSKRVADHVAPHFHGELEKLSGRLLAVSKVLDKRSKVGPDAEDLEVWQADLELSLTRIERPMRSLLRSIESIAPVALKDPRKVGCDGQGCVKFALAGDIQYHGNLTALQRFLAMFDSNIAQPSPEGRTRESAPFEDADFILFAGDLADAAAMSAGYMGFLLNTLGALPPKSPYGEKGGMEMPELRNQLAAFQTPFFGVPGNHDGYAGYGGLLNVLFDELGEFAGWSLGAIDPDSGRKAEETLKGINDYIPTFVGWRLVTRMPRYDGLGEWQHYLGPLNTAFEFRKHSFIGLNSYDLTAAERASVGAVVINFGGGVQDEAVQWMDEMVNLHAPDLLDDEPERYGKQFVYMHQDPRAAHPQKTRLAESHFGIYDATDSPISMLTLGHFGIGNSPRTGLYLPLVTPVMSNVTRILERVASKRAGTWMMEWMRKPDWSIGYFDRSISSIGVPPFFDHSLYNGRGLIEVINCNLAGRSADSSPPVTMQDSRLDDFIPLQTEEEHCNEPKGQISHVVFAHNDVPLEAEWGDTTQRGAIFREPLDYDWKDSVFTRPYFSLPGALMGMKYRNGNPPLWARRLRLGDEDGNATVLRLDDVGNAHSYHGFHMVTLFDDGRVEIDWVSLPN